MRAYERLLNYVQIQTTSSDETKTVPSTKGQFELANLLVREMKDMGIEDATLDKACYVYGSIPATSGLEALPCIGFLAHLDTSPDASGENIKPIIHKNYNGEDIVLSQDVVLSQKMLPHLVNLVGSTLITANGSTLLGADDKSGIAEILTMAEILLNSDTPHPRVAIAFTPDEEIGHGASDLDLDKFGARFAYTVDGGAENEVEYETFNAAEATFQISGKSVHPGEAKGKMINAGRIACEIERMLPDERPENTQGREGFFHLTDISGNVAKAQIIYIIRDHESISFESRIRIMKDIETTLNKKYGDGTVKLSIKEQYRNMADQIRPHMHLIENAKEAIAEIGLSPRVVPVRGGTDGAQLSYRGLPCPNLGTGGYAFHGPYEHVTVEAMDRMVEILLRIVKRYAK